MHYNFKNGIRLFFIYPSNYLSVYHDKDPLFNIIPVTKFLKIVI